MENNQSFLDQLEALLYSGIQDNIELALEIADGLELVDEMMQPWRVLWKYYSEKEVSDIQILKELLNLYEINLDRKRLNEIPEIIFKMKYLRIADFSGNLIKELPEALFKMNSLICLNLNDNLLEHVPDNLFKMSNLCYLELSRNYLKEISDLALNLKVLNVSDNKIKTNRLSNLKNNKKGAIIISSFHWLSGMDFEDFLNIEFGEKYGHQYKFNFLQDANNESYGFEISDYLEDSYYKTVKSKKRF